MSQFSDEECIEDAMKLHPECQYGEVRPGLSPFFHRTRVVLLWRNFECFSAGDPPRHEVEGYAP